MNSNHSKPPPTFFKWLFADGRHGSFVAGFLFATMIWAYFSILPRERALLKHEAELVETRSCIDAGRATSLEALQECFIDASAAQEAMEDGYKQARPQTR